jgi:hypothetical protein
MTNTPKWSVPEEQKHWAEELLKTPKRDLVSITTSFKEQIGEAVIDYSAGHFNRLSDVLENNKMRTLAIIEKNQLDTWINLDFVIWIEIKNCYWKEMTVSPEKLAEIKPVEVEIVFSNWVWVKGVIYLKMSSDVHKRISNSNFLNVVNISEISTKLDKWERVWTPTKFRMMSVNTKHIWKITKVRDLFKIVKVWVEDKESPIRWKKKQIDKMVPLDYVEEVLEWNNLLWNNQLS